MPDIQESDTPPIVDLRSSRQLPANPLVLGMAQASQWGQLAVEGMENVPQLMWPASNFTYHAMRNDSQVDALLSGVWLPIMRMRWSLSPNKAPDGVVQKIAEDYNIPIQGDEPEEDMEGFDFADHLYHAMLAAAYGHMYFDQWGTIQGDGLWHIEQLREMMPQTLSEINIADDGTLFNVKQMGNNIDPPPIPGERIAPYVWQKEGSNWVGRSMLRPLYRDWLLKDRVLRVNVINIQRSGAGVPTVEAPPGATPAQIAALDEMAQAYKAGEDAGGALPNGAKLRLMGVEGQQPDAIRTAEYHDEAMARSFLAMVIQLGQTKTGSRALGGTFSDMATLAMEAVAGWFQQRFNRYVIRRDVRWNYADQKTRCPRLVYETFDNPNLAVADLVSLIDKKAILVDTELRQHIRKKYRLPEEDTAEIERTQAKMLEQFNNNSPDNPANNPPNQAPKGGGSAGA